MEAVGVSGKVTREKSASLLHKLVQFSLKQLVHLANGIKKLITVTLYLQSSTKCKAAQLALLVTLNLLSLDPRKAKED